MRFIRYFLLIAVGSGVYAQSAKIVVHPDQVTNQVSRYMTGACLEDINHEVYGGIYSQMIFGESFQEPAPYADVKDFIGYDGTWSTEDGVLDAAGGRGPKLISNLLPFEDGEVSVDLLFTGRDAGNAGLVLRVNNPGSTENAFQGYEVSLDPEEDKLILGWHSNDWNPIKEIPCDVPTDRWIKLTVRMQGKSLEILIDGRSVLTYIDKDHPVSSGLFGLRTWLRPAKYRNLSVTTGGQTRELDFKPLGEQFDVVSAMWRAVRTGSVEGQLSMETKNAFLGKQSQRISFASGKGEIGIFNRGLNRWGLNYVKGKAYEGCLWVKPDTAVDLYIACESVDGARTYAEKHLKTNGMDWQRLDFSLKPNAADKNGRFSIKLKAPGSIVVGYVFLQPGEWGRFEGLPVRKDVAKAMVDQGLTVLRYGGCMANAGEYRWKNMIGPRDKRLPYKGFWYRYSTNGWGIFDFLNFCEAAGILGIPDICMDEKPGDMADFIEYANGPVDSAWGCKRAEDGHPKPYGLKYIELGNEERVSDYYWQRFEPMAKAIWAKDPNIVLVVGDFYYGKPFDDPYDFKGAANITSLAAHKKILDLANQYGAEVWFDVHIWTQSPDNLDGLAGIPSFIKALGEISPGARYKVVVFEFNSTIHSLQRAIANAHAINELERMGGVVKVVASANALQPYLQNDDGWDQGLLFLSNSKCWGQPPYYVTQMVSENYLPNCVRAEVGSPGDALDVTAKMSDDGKIVQLQVVNQSDKPLEAEIEIPGFIPIRSEVQITELSGQLEDENTPEHPKKIVPKHSRMRIDGRLTHIFPPRSFSILRYN